MNKVLALWCKDWIMTKKTMSAMSLMPIVLAVVCSIANKVYFIPILSMLLSVYLPGLVIQSISFDEQSKWKNYVRVLPVSVTDEALSKYIPLFLYCIISGGIIWIYIK